MGYVACLLIVGTFGVLCAFSMLIGFVFNLLFNDLFDEKGEDTNDDNDE